MNTSSAIAELQLEAEGIFASSGGVVVVAPDSESGSVIKLVSRTGSLKVKFFPERNAVRWDSFYEYGFKRIPEETPSLPRSRMRRLHR